MTAPTPPAGPPYRFAYAKTAADTRAALERRDTVKFKKVNKALKHLSANPRHPGLQAHKYDALDGSGPEGADVWTAYVENKTPGAWRIFYSFSKAHRDVIHIISIGPHP